MKPRAASYFRHGFTMSRNARISHRNNEHPITFWMDKLAMDKVTIQKMLIPVGIHHTGLYAKRTQFYRLPRLNNEKELKRFYEAFNSIPATKKKCINYMSNYFQEKTRNVQENKSRPKRIRPGVIIAQARMENQNTEVKKSWPCRIRPSQLKAAENKVHDGSLGHRTSS